MDWIMMLSPIISHIIAGVYLQKQRYNKYVTACFWGVFAICSACSMLFLKNTLHIFLALLFAQFAIFCASTIGPIGEQIFLFLTYANAFSICIGINLILTAYLPQTVFLPVCSVGVIILMHLFVYKILLVKYQKTKKFFVSGWWKPNVILAFTLVQFLNQYAFKIVDKNSASNLLFDFIVFSVIFNVTLIFAFNSVENISEINKKTYENDRLKDMAYKDALTNMQNRLAYVNFTKKERLSHQMNGGPSFVFAMLDIDGFKNINDTQGHAKGDEILKLVGVAITEHFEPLNCHCFRIGGDEFVLLLEDMGLSETLEQIESLNKKLLNKVTLSYGCSAVDFNEEKPFESAYKRADAIMYAHKQQKKITV